MINVRIATENDVSNIISFLEDKCHWLKQKESIQWQTGYTTRYNSDYFFKCMAQDDIVIICEKGNSLVGILMLKQHSEYFTDINDNNSYYLTHFASSDLKAGRAMLINALHIAKLNKRKYLRGDCNVNVPGLLDYYKRLGAKVIRQGTAHNGQYEYALLEYKIM